MSRVISFNTPERQSKHSKRLNILLLLHGKKELAFFFFFPDGPVHRNYFSFKLLFNFISVEFGTPGHLYLMCIICSSIFNYNKG